MLDTTFPHDKPQMLYWNVQSEIDGEATIEITYFTSGITWSADYVCIADPDEKQMDFEGFVRVFNNSRRGVRGRPGAAGGGHDQPGREDRPAGPASRSSERRTSWTRGRKNRACKARAAEDDRRARPGDGRAARAAPTAAAEKQIVKEGLSEYFIYTIEGTETIPNGWSQADAVASRARRCPSRSSTATAPPEYGDQLVRMYLLTNDKESKLGTTPLPDGVVRVFRDNGRDGLSLPGRSRRSSTSRSATRSS